MDTNPVRIDAADKVTGKAQYTADLYHSNMLVGAVLGSKYAHANIKSIDTSEARALHGVLAVLTSKDAPQHYYTPCGHPFSFDPSEVLNMRILTDKARFAGDPIAAVVARNEVIARKALDLLKVEYDVLEAVFTPRDAMEKNAPQIHQMCPGNIVSDSGEYSVGLPMEEAVALADHHVDEHFSTSAVSHGHLELCSSYVSIDAKGRITVVTATQIPALLRFRLAEIFHINVSDVRVVKPCVGGGFGNKQDAQQEPLNVLMSMAVGGRPVRLSLSREECMTMTRTRYAFNMDLKIGANKDGKLIYIDMLSVGNGGAYATHNHSIALTTVFTIRLHYAIRAGHFKPITAYTNLPSAGAMRGYGCPQGTFAFESAIDELALKVGMDPLDFRLMNLNPEDFVDEDSGAHICSLAVADCFNKGATAIDWYQKRTRFDKENPGRNIRRGVGCAMFAFTSGTYPVNVEPGSARLTLVDDGNFLLQVGATEIGQGSDTVFAQMAAEVLDVSISCIRVVSTQDTDVTPFDTGAFATRQTFVAGTAVVKAAADMKRKILDFVSHLIPVASEMLDLEGGSVVVKKTRATVMGLREVALHSLYNKVEGGSITSDVCMKRHDCSPVFGCTFAEVEVDIDACQAKLVYMINVHDSGRIINRRLAEGQVQGGMSMGMGYALLERLQYDDKGAMLNNNLLDYKLPTIMDTPVMDAAFIENYAPTGPLGAKGLGEPPACSPAAAIRNAILHATGIPFNSLPITPHKMFAAFKDNQLI